MVQITTKEDLYSLTRRLQETTPEGGHQDLRDLQDHKECQGRKELQDHKELQDFLDQLLRAHLYLHRPLLISDPSRKSYVEADIPEAVDRTQVEDRENSSNLDLNHSTITTMQDRNIMERDLATTMSRASEKYLGIDLLDRSNKVAVFIGHLLDTIHLLETKQNFAATSGENSLESGEEGETGREGVLSRARPEFQVFHQVFCNSDRHSHSTHYFKDEPTLRKDPSSNRSIVTGEVPIKDIDLWLRNRPQVSFVVVKEHDCVTQQMVLDDHILARPGGGKKSCSRKERIRICSQVLDKALQDISEYYPYRSNSKEIEAPYVVLFHMRAALIDRVEHDEKYSSVLKPLVTFLSQQYASEYDAAEELFSQGLVTRYHASKLFRPNEIVLVRQEGKNEACVLTKIYSIESDIKIEGWSWSYNGVLLRRRSWFATASNIPDQEVTINELEICPLRHAREQDVAIIRSRGIKFWEMRKQGLVSYTGWDVHGDRYYVDTRFMYDTATYFALHTETANNIPTNLGALPIVIPGQYDAYDHLPQSIQRDAPLPPNMEILLPGTIRGFNIEAKKWVLLNVDGFSPVTWNEKAFDRLVLDAKTKEMIFALVKVQRSRDKKMDDIIKGKGNGLIILLHGGPGTGKTLTAESVAEIAHKPLYRVTCGDIGTSAEMVEKYLDTVLHLGKIWDCVLLMDEADVFLEERTMADLQRNSLVSEYHEGILILTSNRVGTFDEAFKSRIQVAIHYENLSKRSRKAIWKNFFDMIEETNEDANIAELEEKVDELSDMMMNGRQIRNALLTARQLAKYRNETLAWEHLDQVLKTSAAFNKYLEKVRGGDDKRARDEEIR
ncbi:hypothetical protein JX266_009884 [Neoarthrinium moseri]|nr:hypothetical protein JX266_009884 [Neoarthrinium moseri]